MTALSWDTSGFETTGTVAVVPEPATMLQAALGMAGRLGLGWLRRRRMKTTN